VIGFILALAAKYLFVEMDTRYDTLLKMLPGINCGMCGEPGCAGFNVSFVFGSEEYPEFVSGSFNDGFGIFISGPNPAGGNYNNYNIARLPNGQLVSIDNVNANTNAQYYNTNNTGVIQYDGYTDGLTAQLSVIPCSTYHVKIIIADARDS
jgi:hypothetical protein